MAKKRSGCLTVFLVVVSLIIATVLGAYFLLPGLARPYDYGVKSSEASYESAVQKLGIAAEATSGIKAGPEYKTVYGDPKDVQAELSSEEVTSLLNKSSMNNNSLKNVQVRINKDNTIDTAGTVDTDYVFDKVLKGKYTREDAKKALPMLGILPDDVNFSCNIDFEVKDNKAQSVNINRISVMGISIPEALTGADKAGPFAEKMLDGYLQSIAETSGTSYDLIQINNGMLEFDGKFPSSISQVPLK